MHANHSVTVVLLLVVLGSNGAHAAAAPIPQGASVGQRADFEFNDAGELPSNRPGISYDSNMGFPASAFFSQSCGILQQFTYGFAGYAQFTAGTHTPGGFSLGFNAPRCVAEARIRTTALAGPGAVIGISNGTYSYFVYISGPNTLWVNASVPVTVPNLMQTFRTIRIEGNSGMLNLWVDNVQYGFAIGVTPSAHNGFYFGDSSSGGSGNFEWDYIRFENGAPCSNVGQANSSLAQLEINGVGGGACQGPFTLTGLSGSQINLTWHGPNSAPFALLHGPQNPGGTTIPNLGILDIGTMPFSDVVIVLDGITNPLPIFVLNGCGVASLSFTLPSVPAGIPMGNLQGLVLQANGTMRLTAAFYLSS